MMASVLTAALVLLVGLLVLAVVGALLRPRHELNDPFLHATRAADETLHHRRSLEPSGEKRTAAGRMYAAPPSARLPAFFRRAL